MTDDNNNMGDNKNYHYHIMFIIYVQYQFRNSKWFIHNMFYYYTPSSGL